MSSLIEKHNHNANEKTEGKKVRTAKESPEGASVEAKLYTDVHANESKLKGAETMETLTKEPLPPNIAR